MLFSAYYFKKYAFLLLLPVFMFSTHCFSVLLVQIFSLLEANKQIK
jgi:hypothetical protein